MSCRGCSAQKQEPFDVVDESDQADFRCGPSDADRVDEQFHLILLLGKERARPSSGISILRCWRTGLPLA
jgi:hypothetical protein